jgi:hypothetical protein
MVEPHGPVGPADPPAFAGPLQEGDGAPTVLDALEGLPGERALLRQEVVRLAQNPLVAAARGLGDGAAGALDRAGRLSEEQIRPAQQEVVVPEQRRLLEPFGGSTGS